MALIPGEWYALQVRGRHEEAVETSLRDRGYTVCLPCVMVPRRWSDRVRTIRAPLFPGYVFVLFDPSISNRMVESPGVIRIVGFGSRPVPVDRTELESARILAASGLQVQTCGPIAGGELVTICHGPLAGLRGRVLRVKSGHRVVVQLFLLQRSVVADLDDHSVMLCNMLTAAVPPSPAAKEPQPSSSVLEAIA